MRVGFQKSSKTKICNSREKRKMLSQRKIKPSITKKQFSIDMKNEQSKGLKTQLALNYTIPI